MAQVNVRAGDAARNSFDGEGAERWFRQAYGSARRLVQDRKAQMEVQLFLRPPAAVVIVVAGLAGVLVDDHRVLPAGQLDE